MYFLTNVALEEFSSNMEFVKVGRSCEGKLTKAADFKTSAIARLQSIRKKNLWKDV